MILALGTGMRLGEVLAVRWRDVDVRVLSLDGEMLRHLTLDPSRDYQPPGS